MDFVPFNEGLGHVNFLVVLSCCAARRLRPQDAGFAPVATEPRFHGVDGHGDGTSVRHLLLANIVTTSKALVTSSVALVPSSVLTWNQRSRKKTHITSVKLEGFSRPGSDFYLEKPLRPDTDGSTNTKGRHPEAAPGHLQHPHKSMRR